MAEQKRHRHQRKISYIEKKHPIFDLHSVHGSASAVALRKLEKMGIELQPQAVTNTRRLVPTSEILNFIDQTNE